MAEDRKWRGDQPHGPGDRNRQQPQSGDGGGGIGCPFVAVPVAVVAGVCLGVKLGKLWKTRSAIGAL